MCISRRRDSTYRRYLAEQERLALVLANREAGGEMIASEIIRGVLFRGANPLHLHVLRLVVFVRAFSSRGAMISRGGKSIIQNGEVWR